jgi:hypothetical protein
MFWTKNNPGRIKLISFHIPKTAGTSFSEILQKQYGKKLLKIYDQPLLDQCKSSDLPVSKLQKFSAIHGHFMASKAWLKAFPDAYFITWIRDPYERLCSHYTFWQHTKTPGKDAALFRKNTPSLLTFCTDEVYHKRNRIYKYFLQDFPIDKLSFVGEISSLEEDMQALAAQMRWKKITRFPKLNMSPEGSSLTVEKHEKIAILEALADEYKIYHKLLDKRKQLIS